VGPTTYGPCRRPAVGPVEGTFNGPAIGPKRKFTGVRPISITDGCFHFPSSPPPTCLRWTTAKRRKSCDRLAGLSHKPKYRLERGLKQLSVSRISLKSGPWANAKATALSLPSNFFNAKADQSTTPSIN
jgi:hypothetical protein